MYFDELISHLFSYAKKKSEEESGVILIWLSTPQKKRKNLLKVKAGELKHVRDGWRKFTS